MTNNPAPNNESVPPEDRREVILQFLAEHDMAVPPLVIYAGLKRQKNITFAYRTVQNALSDLVEQGHVMRVDTQKLRDEGKIAPVEEASSRRSYYFITDEGLERLEE